MSKPIPFLGHQHSKRSLGFIAVWNRMAVSSVCAVPIFEYKYLGVYYDERLKWRAHINHTWIKLRNTCRPTILYFSETLMINKTYELEEIRKKIIQ